MRSILPRVPWLFAGMTVLGHISWILVPTSWRTPVTVLSVVTFFLASATHAVVQRGPRWAAAFLAITVPIGWLVEAVGTKTGLPFGDYTYTDALGWSLLEVPLVIPLAWSMMAYPALLAAQRLTTSRPAAVFVGAGLFASWDLFLDPQMVTAGYWVWNRIDTTLPGIADIPVQNFLGWLLVALVLMALLDRLPRRAADDRVPVVMLSWVYPSNVMAAAVFFGRPGVAAWGALAMGVFVLPWWRSLAQGRR